MKLTQRMSCLLLCLAWSTTGGAAVLEDLYTASATLSGRGNSAQNAAFQGAMRDVLARVTGRRDAADLETLKPLVNGAARYVRSFQAAPGGQLAISFDGSAIEAAIDQAGLPYWSPERPLTLVWLAVDRGGGRRSLVTANSSSDEQRQLERVARQRGIPLAWPSASDDLRSVQDAAWNGSHGALLGAARRYGADGVLIGRASLVAGQWAVRWTFQGAGMSFVQDGDLETGAHEAADRYASIYASRTAGQRSEQLVTITGIDSLEAYAHAQRALQRLEAVRGLNLREVGAGQVTFEVTLRGDPQALAAAVRRDGRLTVIDGPGLIFALQP